MQTPCAQRVSPGTASSVRINTAFRDTAFTDTAFRDTAFNIPIPARHSDHGNKSGKICQSKVRRTFAEFGLRVGTAAHSLRCHAPLQAGHPVTTAPSAKLTTCPNRSPVVTGSPGQAG